MAVVPDACNCVDVAADLVWVGDVVGQPVTSHHHLVGGMSSIVVRCEFARETERAPDPLVLRVITDTGLLQREPDVIAREAEALRILRPSDLHAPEVIGSHYSPDVGRLLMTWCPGRMIIQRTPLEHRVEDLADLAAAIATTPLPAGHALGPWWSWADDGAEPPPWGDAGLWREAIELHRSRPAPSLPDDKVVLLHRDFHPLNVLWVHDRAARASVVDWVNACVGHPHAELGHCRWNLAVTVGPDAPGVFLDRYLEQTSDRGYGDYDIWWDIDSLLDKLPGPFGTSGWRAVGRTDLSSDRVAAVSETFLRSVLTR